MHWCATLELSVSRLLWCVRQCLGSSYLCSNRTPQSSQSQPYGIQDLSSSNQETDQASFGVDGSKKKKLARLTDSILQTSTSPRVTPEVILWTDLFTTLCQIKNNKTWKQYVQHWVNDIREKKKKNCQWRHCPWELNPTDLPSQGCSIQELMKN